MADELNRHKGLRRIHRENLEKKNISLTNLPGYAEKHNQGAAKQRAEERDSTMADSATSQEEPVSINNDMEPGMLAQLNEEIHQLGF